MKWNPFKGMLCSHSQTSVWRLPHRAGAPTGWGREELKAWGLQPVLPPPLLIHASVSSPEILFVTTYYGGGAIDIYETQAGPCQTFNPLAPVVGLQTDVYILSPCLWNIQMWNQRLRCERPRMPVLGIMGNIFFFSRLLSMLLSVSWGTGKRRKALSHAESPTLD